MGYLAELAWAADAIVANASLGWGVIDTQTYRVSAGIEDVRAEIELRLNESGQIGSIEAEDWPRKEGTSFIERLWRGRFFDYTKHQGRWLPFGGEVGWVLDGEMSVAWRGKS